MRLLTPEFVDRWRDRLINIHPSLLPAFKGLDTHERVLAAGVRLSGCTVHFVRADMDDGPIILQAAVPVHDGDDPDGLAARVLRAEHRCYPAALKLIADRGHRVSRWWATRSGCQTVDAEPASGRAVQHTGLTTGRRPSGRTVSACQAVAPCDRKTATIAISRGRTRRETGNLGGHLPSMTTGDRQSEQEAFLASKQAMWGNFIWLCTGGTAAVIVLLIVLALIFVV